MTTIIDADVMTSIRNLLGEDETSLPDGVILDELVGGAAEAMVLGRVEPPAYADRPADEQAAIRRAVAYLTAATILDSGAYRNKWSTTSEKFSDQYSTARAAGAVDLPGWRTSLRARAEAILDDLAPRTSGPAMFTLAAGRRGA